MESTELYKLKYPLGPFEKPSVITADQISTYIHQIETLPQRLRWVVKDLLEMQLETPYRPQGWTVRQVVHHLPDSHLNAFIRFKLALTENQPTIRPYDEAAWANLPDSQSPLDISLDLLKALHARWTILLKNLQAADWEKEFIHPEHGTRFRLDETLAMYAWHGNHHLAQIEKLVERKTWGQKKNI